MRLQQFGNARRSVRPRRFPTTSPSHGRKSHGAGDPAHTSSLEHPTAPTTTSQLTASAQVCTSRFSSRAPSKFSVRSSTSISSSPCGTSPICPTTSAEPGQTGSLSDGVSSRRADPASAAATRHRQSAARGRRVRVGGARELPGSDDTDQCNTPVGATRMRRLPPHLERRGTGAACRLRGTFSRRSLGRDTGWRRHRRAPGVAPRGSPNPRPSCRRSHTRGHS